MVAYSFKRRFVAPIRAGLSSVRLSWDPHPKRQTIRAIGKRRHARPGETLQLYHGMRSRECFKIGDASCIAADGIRLFIRSEIIEIRRAAGNSELIDKAGKLDAFAQDDGFDDWADMRAFWLQEHDGKHLGPFIGVLIQWEPK